MFNQIRKLASKLLPKYFKEKIKIFYWKITNNYLTNKPLGSKDKYLQIFSEAKKYSFPNIDNYILKNNFKNIDLDFFNNLALITQVSIKKSKINYQHGRILYALIDNYISKNKNKNKNDKYNFLDIGTAKGFSSIVITKAATDNSVDYEIQTYDIVPHNKPIYWNSILDIDGKKTREELLEQYSSYTQQINYFSGRTKTFFKKLNTKRINFAFVDGSHDYDDVIFEYKHIKTRQEAGDIIMFDDVTPNHFNGIVKLVGEITDESKYNIELLMSSDYRGYAIATKK